MKRKMTLLLAVSIAMMLTLQAQQWTDPGLGKGTPIRAVHITEIREALAQQILPNAAIVCPPWTDDPIIRGITRIKAIHITELRECIDDVLSGVGGVVGGGFTLSGHVRDSSAGTSISGGTLQIQDGPHAGRATTTDATGRYSISNVAGDMEIRARATGYRDEYARVTLDRDRMQDFSLVKIAAGLPVAGAFGTAVTSYSARSADFTVDVFALDADSNLISLNQNAFTINSFESNGINFDFRNQGVGVVSQGNAGPYSATFLLDQSGSIQSTDPGDTRIDAAEVFMDKLSRGDEVALLSFTGDTRPPVTQHRDRNGTRFTNDPDGFDAELRRLAGAEGGSTPLYDAIITAVDYTVAHASNTNRAVLIFTDGEDTSSSASVDDAISAANRHNVALHTVALSASTDLHVLTRLANSTGGSVAYASDARQLISYYGALGRYLSGADRFYRTSWNVNIDSGNFGPGWSISAGVRIATQYGQLYAPFRIEFSGSSTSTSALGNKDPLGFVIQAHDGRPPLSVWE